MTMAIQGLQPGDIIQDTYQIVKLLGEGGMGATFEGTNRTTGHPVAIKVMSAEIARNDKAVQLFRRESSLMRTVQSDAVARYETTLQDSQGRLFLIMEYVPGNSLADYIKKGARLNPLDVARLGLRLSTGLAAIHKLNIVHRDIAPDNIQVPDENIVGAKLIDFGLASNTIGTEKSIIGDYMAPEQLGLFGGKASAATDVYALGLVLMRIAGLPVPGEGQGAGAIEIRRKDISLKGSGLPPVLAKTLRQMLRADPAKRSVDLVPLFHKTIGALENGTGTGASKTSVTGLEGGVANKSKAVPITIILAVVAAFGVGVYFHLSKPALLDGESVKQAEKAQYAVTAQNPFEEVDKLITANNLDAAFGALMALSVDETKTTKTKIEALLRVAGMYDPETHDIATSPFPRPNAGAARRMYQRAADLGSDMAQAAMYRLGE
jgi:hypothetical protein